MEQQTASIQLSTNHHRVMSVVRRSDSENGPAAEIVKRELRVAIAVIVIALVYRWLTLN